jgi:hypothetical protein
MPEQRSRQRFCDGTHWQVPPLSAPISPHSKAVTAMLQGLMQFPLREEIVHRFEGQLLTEKLLQRVVHVVRLEYIWQFPEHWNPMLVFQL